MEYKVKIKVDIKRENSKAIHLKYFVPNANWYTYYDLKVKDIDQPAIINRKAYVSQNTGEEWTNVKLTLSNANPLQNNQLPDLIPKILTNAFIHKNKNGNKIYGRIVDRTGMAVIAASIHFENTKIGTTSNYEGYFELDYKPNNHLLISYVGYTSQRIKPKNGQNLIVMRENANLLDEIATVGVFAGATDGVSPESKKQESMIMKAEEQLEKDKIMSFLRNAVAQSKVKTINSVEYQIEDNYTIKSNDQEIDVLLSIETINCLYEYYAVPMKSSSTFLTLQIPDWHKLDLLPGQINLYLSNAYKGKTSINPYVTSDTLSISIGVDPEVIVERELVKEDYDKKFLSNKIEEYFTYKTTVKNNKSKSIAIKILDQIPVSSHEDIEINNVEISNMKLNKESGEIEWKLNLEPGESADKKLSYSVKYPQEFKGILD